MHRPVLRGYGLQARHAELQPEIAGDGLEVVPRGRMPEGLERGPGTERELGTGRDERHVHPVPGQGSQGQRGLERANAAADQHDLGAIAR